MNLFLLVNQFLNLLSTIPRTWGVPYLKGSVKDTVSEGRMCLSWAAPRTLSGPEWVREIALLTLSCWKLVCGSCFWLCDSLGGWQVLSQMSITGLGTSYYWLYEWETFGDHWSHPQQLWKGTVTSLQGQDHAYDHFGVGLTPSHQFERVPFKRKVSKLLNHCNCCYDGYSKYQNLNLNYQWKQSNLCFKTWELSKHTEKLTFWECG